MKNRVLHVAALVTSLAWASTAFASDQLYVNAALFYGTETTKIGDNKSESTKTFYNAGIGLKMDSGLILGAKYLVLDETAKAGDDDDDTGAKLTGLGATLGYLHDSGFGLAFTYLFEPEKEILSDGDTVATGTGGTGSVIDVGYYFDQGDYAIGPQISVVSATYKEFEYEELDVELDDDYEETFTYPYIAMFFYF